MSQAPRRATVDDLLAAYGTDGRAEVIHGEILEKASPIRRHSFVQTGIVAALQRRYARPPGGRWPGGWWFGSEIHVQYEAHEIFDHDIAGWRRDRVPVLPDPWPVQIRPDWVCEILSASHEKRDRVDKLWVLHAAGVPHYWIVDHETKTLYIHRWQRDGYLLAQTVTAQELARPEPFDATELRVAALFGDEPDEE